MKENRRLANPPFGLQTPDVCEHTRLCGGPHYRRFITRELCADAVFFHFLCLAGSNRPPPISLQPTARGLCRSDRFWQRDLRSFGSFLQDFCHFSFLYLELLVTNVCVQHSSKSLSGVSPANRFCSNWICFKRGIKTKGRRRGCGKACAVWVQVLEKSNSCRGHDLCKHECVRLALPSTSGGFVLINLHSHAQTHTHSGTLRHWHSSSLTHSLHLSWPFMYQWLHWRTCVSLLGGVWVSALH